jgi:aldose 1-epimerase
VDTIRIHDGRAEAVIVPGLGGGLARYDWRGPRGPIPVFRPCEDLSHANPFSLACNLLVPWSNRISQGGFPYGGEFHRLDPNLPGEPFPIHGNGFQEAWAVEEQEAASARLSLSSNGPGPFRYEAAVDYTLQDGCLAIRLTVRNRRDIPLPYGLGLHPWFPRSRGTLLQAAADVLWLEDERYLPAGSTSPSARKGWDFSRFNTLPDAWINNGFTGWNGQARILWKDRSLQLDIEADPPLSTYLVYSPSGSADFFCFEPVTHPVDAHHLPGGPLGNGLVELAPGEELSVSACFRPAAASP